MSSRDLHNSELRTAARLPRQAEHSWQLRLEDDKLITKNIVNLSAAGMAFKAPASSKFSPGQALRFSLSIEPGTSYDCEGRVLWAKASTEKPGSMHQIGIQFSKLPPQLDASIVKQIDEYNHRSQRDRMKKGRRPLTEKIVMSTPQPLRAILIKIFGALIIMSLTSAFLAAMWIHKEAQREQSLAQKFNQSLMRKISSSNDR